MNGDIWGYVHLTIFLYHVFLIIASHLKCMLSEPGVLPKDYEELDSSKLPLELSLALQTIQNELMGTGADSQMGSASTDITMSCK